MDKPQNNILNGSLRYGIEYFWVAQKYTGILRVWGYSRGQLVRLGTLSTESSVDAGVYGHCYFDREHKGWGG
ncbi:MAG: hypothetical protein WCA07_11560 [Gloeobacterales cyanobacterium]